jgi:prepilin-type N-terminal cleavage/methylation domain-containing protein/prepilin-type processing-associated H-X9-DG protein
MYAALWTASLAVGASYNEFDLASGDLSDNVAAPKSLVLDPGFNGLFAESSFTDVDLLTIVVPANRRLDAIVIDFHDDPSNRVFAAIQSGSAWTAGVDEMDPGLLLGYVDFPPDLQNHVGEDILDDMGLAADAAGFVPPLASGSYTLLFRTPTTAVRFALSFHASIVGGALPGDFNGDQSVNGGDLLMWRGAFGLSAAADADVDGDSDGADFLIWQRHEAASVAVGVATPEPASGGLVVESLACLALVRVRRHRGVGSVWNRRRRAMEATRRSSRIAEPLTVVARGMTLVELLVVMVIVTMMAALILPAFGSAREAARRRSCGNNLKQVGLALHNYSSIKKTFPAGYRSELKPNGDDAGPGWAWGVELLPHLEQNALYESVDFAEDVSAPASTDVRMTSLPGFICPSDGDFEQFVDVRLNMFFKPKCRMAAASYVGSTGTVRPTCILCRDNFDGVFGRNRPVELREIVDGYSNTLAAGERARRWASAAMWGVVAGSKLFDNQNPGEFAAGPGYVLGTTFKDGFNICTTQFDDPLSSRTYAESFGSEHPGGCHFVFCDGGVRFVYDDVDPGVMNALATRDGQSKDGKTDPIIHQSPF